MAATVVRDPAADRGARCRALSELQRAGALDVETVIAAFLAEDADVRDAAAAIVRHGWHEVPEPLLRALDGAPLAARSLLRELAIAPRPALATWAAAWVQPSPGRPLDDRCLALAARGTPLAARDVQLLLDTLQGGETGDGFAYAVLLLPAPVADGLLGRLHGLLAAGQVDPARAAPLFDRLSPDGVRQLLALVVTLHPSIAETVLGQVTQRALPIVQERVRAALDGEIPLEPLWLREAGPLLDRPERRERLFAILRDPEAELELQRRAFGALLDARCAAAPVLEWARARETERLELFVRILQAAVEQVPEPLLIEWLTEESLLSHATLQAISRLPRLGEALAAALARTLEADVIEGRFRDAAACLLAQSGSEATLDQCWPRLRTSACWQELFDLLSRRREPFVHELLLAELDAPAPDGVPPAVREAQRDAVRLALTALGDRRQVALLVEHASRSSPGFVRRCAHYASPLPVPFALSLFDAVDACADEGLAVEMAAWGALADDAAVTERLRRWWDSDSETPRAESLREVAVRCLVAGPDKERLVAELRAAIVAGPMPPRVLPLCFEVMAVAPAPLSIDDVRLAAELALLPPLADAAHEAELAARWPDGRFGFPLVAAVAQRLRGSDPEVVRRGFGVVAQAITEDPRRSALSRPRLVVLWRSLEVDRPVQQAVGEATAALFLSLPGAPLGDGPAHLMLMRAAERSADYAAAIVHARAAAAGLLYLPAERQAARLFLGERDPSSGIDPWAALAAAPHRFACLAATAAGDASATADAAVLAREFAGHDAGTLAGITDQPNNVLR